VTPRSRIAIVEDHQLLAETVGISLSAVGFDVTVVEMDAPEAVVAAAAPDASTLVLLDLDLGEPIQDGTMLIPSFLAAGAAVLVVTGVRDRARLAATLEAGALGFVWKGDSFDALLDGIVRAAEGEPVIDPCCRQQLLADLRRHRAEQRLAHRPFELLTPRERQLLSELMRGKTAEAIAAEWVVSLATVRTQVRGVLTKLEVNTQLAAVAKAREVGWDALTDEDARGQGRGRPLRCRCIRKCRCPRSPRRWRAWSAR
jgi:DNA-binding NarL/FixJ family response regulator